MSALPAVQLPRNLDAEAGVIGALLFDGRAVLQVADSLGAGDFYDAKHEAIYAAMLALEARAVPIDLVTVGAELQAQGTIQRLVAVGGEAYLVELANRASTAANIAHHARLVRAVALKRAIVLAAQRMIQNGTDPSVEADEHLEQAQRDLFAVASRSTRRPYKRVDEVLHRTIASLEQRVKEKRAITGVPTGFHELDEYTAGLQPRDLVVVAGRPAMGKTAFALGCAHHAAVDQKIPVLVFSLEMGDQQLVERALCSDGRIDSHQFRRGLLEQQDWRGVHRSARRLGAAPMWIDESPSPSVMEIRTKVMRWRSDPSVFGSGAPGHGLVVIDYLQLISPSEGRGRNDNREQQISEISRGLKALAKETGLAVMALSQLNRSVEARVDKRPLPSDLRESGAIEQDADAVLLLYRDEVYDRDTPDKGIAEVIIGKQRNGPTGTARLAFLQPYTRFENLSQRTAEHLYPPAAAN